MRFAALVALFACAILSASAQTARSISDYCYEEPTGIYSFRIPYGWEKVPYHVVTEIKREMRNNYSNIRMPILDIVIQKANSEYWLEYPYIGIESTKNTYISEKKIIEKCNNNEIVDILSDQLDREYDEFGVNQLSSGYEIVSTKYDSRRHLLISEIKMKISGYNQESVMMMIGVYLIKNGLVRIMCNSEAKDYYRYRNEFDNIIKALSISKEYNYVEKGIGGNIIKIIAGALGFAIISIILNRGIKNRSKVNIKRNRRQAKPRLSYTEDIRVICTNCGQRYRIQKGRTSPTARLLQA